MTWIKRDFFPLELFKMWLSGKVYEYESGFLVILRKDGNHIRIEIYRGSPSDEKAIAVKVIVMQST